jgi:Uncharacterized protein conserved in bacteria|tara:strand:- start:125 stop:538 length:414 start_codon:yes stop_codon:yes gene_type:complete
LTKNISDKDKKAWRDFIDSNDKLENKDSTLLEVSTRAIEKSIDLHGYTLDQANSKIFEFINDCYLSGVKKINVITGKGLRSKNQDNPYQSNQLGMLKFSVPEYIKNNSELMDKVLSIDFESINSPSKGSFDIILKKK